MSKRCLVLSSLIWWSQTTTAENKISCGSASPQIKQQERGGVPSRKVHGKISLDESDFGSMSTIMFQGYNGEHPVVYTKSEDLPGALSTDSNNNTSSNVQSWHGETRGTRSGSATIIKSQNGTMAASFSIEGTVYQLNTMPNGEITINVVDYHDFPDEEHQEQDDEEENEEPTMQLPPGGHPSDGWIEAASHSNTMDHNHDRQLLDHTNSKSLRGNKIEPQAREDTPHHRQLDIAPVVDVLVVYTNKAMCAEAGLSPGCSSSNKGPMENRISLAETETNVAFEASGMTTRIKVVAKQLDTSGFEEDQGTGDFVRALNALRLPNDGLLDYVHGLRDQVGADLVILIINKNTSCGRGQINGPWAVASRICVTGYYSFGHEIGHNFGCYHDRNNANPQAYAHGWQDPKRLFRTVMAYTCPGGGCPRVQRFSNPHTKYLGGAIGDATNDCARRIDERAPIVASWRSPPGGSGCSDEPSGWFDSDGEAYNCAWYANGNHCEAFGNGFANNGVTANMACCACGGGSSSTSGGNSNIGDSTCSDTPQGWYDADGPTYDCEWYGEGDRCELYGDGYTNFGRTAKEACCECGGGSTSSGSDVASCADSPPGWHDSGNEVFDCNWYAQDGHCERYGDGFEYFGKTATEACCACGGGVR